MQALRDQGMSPQAWPHYAPLGMDPNSYRSVGSWANGIYVSTADSYFPAENTPGEQQLAQALQQYSPDTPVDNYALAIGWTPMQYFRPRLPLLSSTNSIWSRGIPRSPPARRRRLACGHRTRRASSRSSWLPRALR